MTRGERLLSRMRASKNGWTCEDLRAVYLARDFEEDQGASHTLYIHRTHTQLRATVTRSSGIIATGYVQTAVKLIDELERLESKP